jgi:hypothetical protein
MLNQTINITNSYNKNHTISAIVSSDKSCVLSVTFNGHGKFNKSISDDETIRNDGIPVLPIILGIIILLLIVGVFIIIPWIIAICVQNKKKRGGSFLPVSVDDSQATGNTSVEKKEPNLENDDKQQGDIVTGKETTDTPPTVNIELPPIHSISLN